MTTPHEHDAFLRFSYDSQRRARIVTDALAPEIDQIEDPRSAATVERDGDALEIRITAADLVALRAGVNSWARLVEVAETVGHE